MYGSTYKKKCKTCGYTSDQLTICPHCKTYVPCSACQGTGKRKIAKRLV